MTPPELFDLRTKLERFKRENLTEDRELFNVSGTIILIGDTIQRIERDDKWKPYVERQEEC